MEVSEQIIEVLNYLAEKFNIAINWSVDNIVPYIQDIMERYRAYAITNNSIWLGIGIICIIVSIFLSFKLKKKYNEWKNDAENDEEDVCLFTAILAVAIGVLIITGVVMIAINLTSLLKWCFIPEVQFYGIVKGLIS